MGSQLRWLERMPDKHEVGGSTPLEPTKCTLKTAQREEEASKESRRKRIECRGNGNIESAAISKAREEENHAQAEMLVK